MVATGRTRCMRSQLYLVVYLLSDSHVHQFTRNNLDISFFQLSLKQIIAYVA